ncbi:hypothetical protein OUZ56_029822 [Daphnia magna]|uniref:Uncharacterized protein n=1 Tax=Daphnia magna TaxID=35525 RepID=A0ABR0B7X5_9CRUS|nr:hypothetical protein OUZ56_029822 [Daphnia magna]
MQWSMHFQVAILAGAGFILDRQFSEKFAQKDYGSLTVPTRSLWKPERTLCKKAVFAVLSVLQFSPKCFTRYSFTLPADMQDLVLSPFPPVFSANPSN